MAQIKYILNDPMTENLIVPVTLPPKQKGMNFRIDGYTGKANQLYSKEHQAACCHYTIVNALKLLNKTLVKPVRKWAATKTLYVQPRAGKQLNAYYDRRALRFFYAKDPITKKMVFAASSTDVVAHELGHAILDAIRPDLFHVQALEIWAFHESFADIHAIINMLQHDMVLDYVLKETKNDLSKPNVVSKLAEEMGTAIFHMTRGRMGHTFGSLRNAVNGFKYMQPEKLPRNGKHNQLTSESHSFSRVFTGAWYDILVAIYNKEKANMEPKKALIKARDIMTLYTYRCLRMAPATIRFYDAIAKAMLAVDKANKYAYNNLMNQVFVRRRILRKPVKPMTSMKWEMYKTILDSSDEIFEDKVVTAVRSKKIESLSLPHFMMNVESPGDAYYEFDEKGKCTDVITSSGEELIDHANFCVEFLKEKDMIRPDKQAPFEMDDEGNLLRSHVCAGVGGCFNNNGTNPTQPEFNKIFKPKNNAGCGCNLTEKVSECVAKIDTGGKICRTTKVRSIRLITQSC